MTKKEAAKYNKVREQVKAELPDLIARHEKRMKPIIGYMDQVDFDHELGAAAGGSRVYPNEKDLKHCQPCVVSCGVVEVEVKLKRVVKPFNFSKEKGVSGKDVWKLDRRRLNRLRAAQEQLRTKKLTKGGHDVDLLVRREIERLEKEVGKHETQGTKTS